MIDCWSARPDFRPWAAGLAERAARWRPARTTGVDLRAVADNIERAAAAGERWLAHPCLSVLTGHAADDAAGEREVRLVTWVAANTNTDLGTLTLDRPSWRWCPVNGAVRVAAGTHDLRLLAPAEPAQAASPFLERAAVDTYCRSIGAPFESAFPDLDATGGADSSPALAATREIGFALEVIARRLPRCAAWAAAVTSVVVPLQQRGGEQSSGSQPELPGLIHLTGLCGPVAALEALVHESAHHHFSQLGAGGALVDPDDRTLYPSPLRQEPRPLERVLLAVHALWHMVRFYDDALEAGVVADGWVERRVRLEARLRAGLTTIDDARSHLTDPGLALVGRWMSSGRTA